MADFELSIPYDGPKRITLARRAGWRLPTGAVSVARPHRYGNPFIIGTPDNGGNITREMAVAEFRKALVEGRLQFSVKEIQSELRGRDLACWCKPDESCHADVLIDLANRAPRSVDTPKEPKP